MVDWVKCTYRDGTTIYVNLDTAASVRWREESQYSVVRFPGTDVDAVRVKERPEALVSAREPVGQ